MAKDVVVTADRIRNWQKLGRRLWLSLLILLLLLIIMYLVLKVIFDVKSFSIDLETNESLESGLIMYESLNDPTPKRKLYAKNIQFMDNISIKWLPKNINDEADGPHNGDNYIAYTFYLENENDTVINYWYSVIQDDVVKNVDEAARIMIYLNDIPTVYAKGSSKDGAPEKDTTLFRDDEDGTIVLEQRKGMMPGAVDKFTVVVWIEGNDPECIDALLGGELRLHMSITEEHIKESVKNWSDIYE